MPSMSFSIGLLYAVLSALFNGSFGTLSKISTVRAAAISPVVFNYWMAEGAAVAGVLALVASPQVFTSWGLLSGSLFVASTVNTFAAIQVLGLSVASGIWCGVAVLTSFGYGVAFAGDRLSNTAWAAVGLSLLVVGIAGIAVAGQMGQATGEADGENTRQQQNSEEQGQLQQGLLVADRGSAAGAQQAQHEECTVNSTHVRHGIKSGIGSFPFGCLAAVAAGLFGGLILAPMLMAPPEARGIPFIPSMSAGIFVATPLATYFLSCLSKLADPLVPTGPVPWLGMTAGAVWQAGNVCSILAVQDPGVGLAVAYPLMQCGLFVAGAWGILLFKEIQGRWQLLYWLAGGILLSGAVLLSAAK